MSYFNKIALQSQVPLIVINDVDSVGKCKTICNNTPTCTDSGYNYNSNQCYLVQAPMDSPFKEASVTANRFNNNVKQEYDGGIYTANGIPSSRSNTSTINTNNSTPFNGAIQNYPYTPDMATYAGSISNIPLYQYQNNDPRNNRHDVNRVSNIIPNTNCPGSDYSKPNVSNMQGCMFNCVSDQQCQAWTYDNANNICYLKNAVPTCKASDNYISGRIFSQQNQQDNQQAPAPIPSGRRVSNNMSTVVFPVGVDSQYVDARNLAQCKQSCLSDNNCNSWTFDPTNRNGPCYVQYGTTTPVYVNPNANSGVIYLVPSTHH